MLHFEYSAILLTCIKRQLILKTIFWSFSEWPFYTGFTVDKDAHQILTSRPAGYVSMGILRRP